MFPHTRSEVSKGNTSLHDSVMKRGEMLCRVIFFFVSLCHLKWLLCLLMLFFFPLVNFTSLAPPLKYEAIAFLSQMSYRLTFKFLSEQSDYFILF